MEGGCTRSGTAVIGAVCKKAESLGFVWSWKVGQCKKQDNDEIIVGVGENAQKIPRESDMGVLITSVRYLYLMVGNVRERRSCRPRRGRW